MKLTVRLLLLSLLATTIASAQNQYIKNVIVVIQENRTPDNLFGSDLHNLSGRQLPNAHLVSTGKCKGMSQAVPLGPFELDAYCFDPDHGHGSWIATWDKNPNGNNGLMDGACQTNAGIQGTCNNLPMCGNVPCPQYTYVTNSVIPTGNYHAGHNVLDGYFNVAINYGYANNMYQTNQGPSFPAHQFLFTGTSAPDTKNDPQGFYQYFAGENPLKSDGKSTGVTGCATAPSGSYVLEVAPDGSESKGYDPPETTPAPGYPCYDHPTMASLLDSNSISWRYYNHAPTGNNTPGSSIWTAPNAISGICLPIVSGQCTGADWTNYVIEPPSKSDASPILDALGVNGECSLPQVSWVIPDGYWSDHPGTAGSDGGPGWIASIVNAVGGVDNDNNPLPRNCGYWQNTVVLITWDDWGGFYDDVDPDPNGTGYPNSGNNNGVQYVYGFRVPLLVVSAYAKQGYTSNVPHDFGSILKFIENTFSITSTINGSVYGYADSFPPDGPTSLSDFFSTQQQPFVWIQGANHHTSCYVTPLVKQTGDNCFPNYPADPDNDAIDLQD